MRLYKKAFTLIELMIVVAIVALLSSIIIPNLLRANEEANNSKVAKELQSIFTAITMYELEKGASPTQWSDLNNYINVAKIEENYTLITE